MDSPYSKVASEETINKAVSALTENGFSVEVVDTSADAKELVLKTIPKGSDVFTNTSVTLDKAGIADAINGEGSDYVSVRGKMMELYGDPTKLSAMKQLTAAPEYSLGSVHAITQDGKLLIASATGSQFPPEAYGAPHVIFVVGAQKTVKDLEDGLKRINEYTVPLEDERALVAYGMNTSFNKLLVLNKEAPGRVIVIIIKENIGF